MRATVAKRIRQRVYGTGHHIGPVVYYRNAKGTITADVSRQHYQRAKLWHKERNKP